MNSDSREDRRKLERSVKYTFSFVIIIWALKLIEIGFQLDFGVLGILPRTAQGSIGIFTAPFIHGDFYHLLSNTFPILILGVGLFYFYDKIALNVILLIYLMTGFWVWMAARDAYHIGASGIVYGLLTFLLFSGFFRRDKNTLAVSFIILVLYGGSFFIGVIPNKPGISWESHLMGAIAGIFCAIYFRNYKIGIKPKLPSANLNSVVEYEYQYIESQSKDNPKVYNYTYTNTKNSASLEIQQNLNEDKK